MSNLFVCNVLDRNMRGWLPVIDSSGNKFSIPYSLKVKGIEREKFEILEGVNSGRVVKINYNRVRPRLFSEYLKPYFATKEQASLVLDVTSKLMKVDKPFGLSRHVESEDIEKGEYQILVPDRQHTEKMSDEYYQEISSGSRFCDTWFPVTLNGSSNQYLHFGSYSEGCITVTEKWQEVYFELITARKIDSVIGTIKVT